MSESNAIAAYIAAKYDKSGRLYPRDPEIRGAVDQRIHFHFHNDGTFNVRLKDVLVSCGWVWLPKQYLLKMLREKPFIMSILRRCQPYLSIVVDLFKFKVQKCHKKTSPDASSVRILNTFWTLINFECSTVLRKCSSLHLPSGPPDERSRVSPCRGSDQAQGGVGLVRGYGPEHGLLGRHRICHPGKKSALERRKSHKSSELQDFTQM